MKHLIGLGFNSDGHKRVTQSDHFVLLGGNQESHEVMTEKVIKMQEKLKKRGKNFATMSREEWHEVATEAGLQRW